MYFHPQILTLLTPISMYVTPLKSSAFHAYNVLCQLGNESLYLEYRLILVFKD